MKLNNLVLSAIRGNSEVRRKLCEALGVSNPTMTRLLKDNSDDLTKAAAMKVIRDSFSLTDEQILLDDEVQHEEAPAA